MKKQFTKFKEGAASFYIVAFSTLILVVIAVSFSAVIVSEITRTSNDDLSQSAYDSALAGIEDAKLAYYNYRRCVESGATAATSKPSGGGAVTCQDIIWYMNNESNDCDVVGHILGRIGKDDEGEVLIQEVYDGSGADNRMDQAYTCVSFDRDLRDYRTTLTSANTTSVAHVRLKEASASDIKFMRVRWYTRSENTQFRFSNVSSNKVIFPSVRNEVEAAAPPMISVGLVQTGGEGFSLESFEKADGGMTNRGTVYLVPTDNKGMATGAMQDNYIGVYTDERGNYVSKKEIVKSNDHTVKNMPYVTYCAVDGVATEFVCSATLELPNPIGGERNDDTFVIVTSIPYGTPTTSVSLEFCKEENLCIEKVKVDGDLGGEEEIGSPEVLSNMQISVDSTGRASNLYRRVAARLDTSDTFFPYPMYAIELLGDGKDGSLIKKPAYVTCEYNFDPTCQ